MNEELAFPFEIKSLTASGTLEGVAAGYGNRDRQGDVIAAGAFAASLAEHRRRGTMPAMLLHHDVARPCGAWETFSETPAGLLVAGRLTLDATDGREAYALLNSKALTGLSVGFSNAQRNHGAGGSEIVAGDLHEVSLVAIGANPAARITRVKSAPTAREIERALAEAGLSNRQAKAGAAMIAKELQAEDPEDEQAARLAAIIAAARMDLKSLFERNI